MQFKISIQRTFSFTFVFLFGLVVCTQLIGADKHHGKRNQHSRKNHNGRSNGFTGISLSPAGIGITLQNRNFGIDIAPGTLGSIQRQFTQQQFAGAFGDQAAGFESPNMVLPNTGGPLVDVWNGQQPLPAQPLVNNDAANFRTVVPTNSAAKQFQSTAENAFKSGNYQAAMRSLHHATIEDPQNGLIHLFGSQIAFAMGDYQASANAILTGTELSPREDWYFVIRNFRRFYEGKEYVSQMSRLNNYCNQHPNESFAQALRAYHFQGLGEVKAANIFAAKAFEIDSRDRLASRLFEAESDQKIMPPVPGPSKSILTEELPNEQVQHRESALDRAATKEHSNKQHSILQN